MKKETIFYEAPTAQTFVVRFGGVLCDSNGIQNSNRVLGSSYEFDEWDELD